MSTLGASHPCQFRDVRDNNASLKGAFFDG